MDYRDKPLYKSPVDTYIFVNDVWVEDVYRVDWDLKRSRVPIYGYDDVYYGQVAEGKQIITGTILVNFTDTSYFTAALRGLHLSGLGNQRKIDPYDRIKNLKDRISKEIEEAYKEDDEITRGKSLSRIMRFARKEGLQDYFVNFMRDLFKPVSSNRLTSLGFEDPIDFNPRHFKLQIYYGHPSSRNVRIREFRKCALMGEGQTISAAGAPNGDMSSSAQVILEVYPFIAQSIAPVLQGTVN